MTMNRNRDGKVQRMKEILRHNPFARLQDVAIEMGIPASTAYDALRELKARYDMRLTFFEKATPIPKAKCPKCGDTHLTIETEHRLKVVRCDGCHGSFLRSQLSRKLLKQLEEGMA